MTNEPDDSGAAAPSTGRSDEDGQRITYLIANHNQGAYIGDCLDSLRRQHSSRWLALIGDDASTDDSVEVIRERLVPGMRLLRNPRNLGYAASLHRLIEEASTDIVGILDPDDALYPEATGRVLRAYREHPEAPLVYTRFALFDEALASRRGVAGAPIPPGHTSLEYGHVGALRTFRRSAYRRTAGLDLSLPYAEDRDLVYKLEELGPAVFVDEVLYRYRQVPGSQSRDPEKREIGARNHLEAKRRALCRRDIRGFSSLLYRFMFRCEYVLYSARYPDAVKVPVDVLWRALLVLDRHLGIRR